MYKPEERVHCDLKQSKDSLFSSIFPAEQYEKLKMTHEMLQKNTLNEKDRMITELNEQQEVLANNLRTVSQEKEQLESMVQGYKTQIDRQQVQFQNCQQQLQVSLSMN